MEIPTANGFIFKFPASPEKLKLHSGKVNIAVENCHLLLCYSTDIWVDGTCYLKAVYHMQLQLRMVTFQISVCSYLLNRMLLIIKADLMFHNVVPYAC